MIKFLLCALCVVPLWFCPNAEASEVREIKYENHHAFSIRPIDSEELRKSIKAIEKKADLLDLSIISLEIKLDQAEGEKLQLLPEPKTDGSKATK